jgi:hypothetical protein
MDFRCGLSMFSRLALSALLAMAVSVAHAVPSGAVQPPFFDKARTHTLITADRTFVELPIPVGAVKVEADSPLQGYLPMLTSMRIIPSDYFYRIDDGSPWPVAVFAAPLGYPGTGLEPLWGEIRSSMRMAATSKPGTVADQAMAAVRQQGVDMLKYESRAGHIKVFPGPLEDVVFGDVDLFVDNDSVMCATNDFQYVFAPGVRPASQSITSSRCLARVGPSVVWVIAFRLGRDNDSSLDREAAARLSSAMRLAPSAAGVSGAAQGWLTK